VQRLSALLGQALAGLDCRSLQRGQRGVLEWPERAGVRIVTCTGVDGDPISLRRSSDFYPTLPSGDLLLCAKHLFEEPLSRLHLGQDQPQHVI